MLQHYRITGMTSAILAAIALFSSCSSQPVTKVEVAHALPAELPKEVQDRFEVRDTTTPVKPSEALAIQEKPEPVSKKKGKKKKGKNTEKAGNPAAGPAAVAFNYPSRRPVRDPIWIGEKLKYVATYFGIAAGELTMEVLPFKVMNGRPVYHARGRAVSNDVMNVIYSVDDVIESFIDYSGLFSYKLHIVLDESKQTRDALELNDSIKKQTFYWNRWNHKVRGYSETKEFAPIEPFSQDSMSALYYLRTLPLPNGAEFGIPVVSEGKSWEAIITVVGREKLDTEVGELDTVKVKF